ncbi:MAG: EAL domain-containing protein, partial [Wenzhouxiangellaceae bacterium]|nr:EAL domain-containing protein [Wenzhouxiangellaceae bacterium]
WVTGVFVVAFLVVSLLLLVGGSLALRRSAGRAFESEARFRATFEEAGVGIAHLDLDGNCLTVNDALADLLGTTPDALTGAGLDEFVPGDDAPIREDARRLIEEGELRAKTDLRMERTDGRAVWANLTITLVSDIRNRPRHFIAIVEDITERRQLADELAYQARHDPVTGLLNRRAFEERLLGAVRRSVRDELECALIYVDLDRFKTVNDSAGHDAGDELLRQMGPLMHACVRANDTVSRLGGDEFCLLLEGCPRDSVLGLAEKLRAAIHEYRFEWQGRSFSISASIGVVPFGGRGATIDQLSPELLVSAADAACYCAKDLGRDKVYVGELDDPALMQQRNQIASLDSLREALEESRFRIMLQPIVPVGEPLNAEATRFEALVRMARPDGELVPPAKFLPAAERYGLIRRIDLWVLRKVIAWLEAGGGADVAESVAVNLSAVSLHSDAFRDEVDALMAATRLPGERICFEITETEAISSLDDARAFIRRMRKRGCRFALDDFGSGFSSFGYLLTLPVQYVKIDGLFVRDVHENLAHEAIVRSVHQVARSMGKQTIAEFVESRPVLDKLAEIGVDFAQGHAIGRPMPMPSNGQPPARGN